MSIRRVAATAAIVALALAGCSSSKDGEGGAVQRTQTSEPNSTKEPSKSEDLPAYNGEDISVDTSETTPKFIFPDTAGPEDLHVIVVEEGTGPEIGPSDFVVADYVGSVWRAEQPFDDSYSRGAPLAMSLDSLVKGWSKGVEGHRVGAKLIISIPPGDLGYEGGNAGAGIGEDDVMVFYVEIHDAWTGNSAGQSDATPETDLASLPVVIEGDLGAPVTAVNVRDPKASVQEENTLVIARGTGPKLATGGTAYVAFYYVNADASSAVSTWFEGAGPQAVVIGNGSLLDSLDGIEVGSRVFLAVPAIEGSGTTSSSPAMYVVVDILGYYDDLSAQ